jgi:23S rRNA (guanosine2251-2'-O)-methyltransferase
VLAALRFSRRVKAVWLDAGAGGPKVDELLHEAGGRGLRVDRYPRAVLDAVSETGIHNGVIAFAEPLGDDSLAAVLDRVERRGEEPFVVLLDEVQYEQNLGAVLRTAAAAAVHAVVVPTRRGAPLSAVAQRVAMGGAEHVPVVREGLLSAVATLQRRGIAVTGADAEARRVYTETDLRGPRAVVLGGEDHGLGAKLRERCDELVRIPMRGDCAVTSLNVSVSAALLIFERLRQQGSPRGP